MPISRRVLIQASLAGIGATMTGSARAEQRNEVGFRRGTYQLGASSSRAGAHGT
jgi:hypothetical protein